MSDANRDEFEKCKRIAQSALNAGDAEKAVRFLQKAKRMCPGDSSIDALLAAAESGAASPQQGGSSEPSRAEPPPSASFTRGSPSASSSARGSPSASGTRTSKDGGSYTDDQAREVQKILRTKDYYVILGVSKDATDGDIKKAYKKLALRLHPDKNKAPGAEEAFKKVSTAVQCLTDEDKKSMYDKYGDEERIPQHHRHHYQQDFMTPEDLFSAFFGGGATFHTFPPRGRPQYHQQADGGEVPGRAQLLQMLPIILIVLMTFSSNIMARDSGSRFSFTPTGTHQNERTTAAIGVNYYVANDFDDHYSEGTRPLAEFEQQVDIYYVRNLHSECDYQEKVKYRKVMLAKHRGNQEELKKAKALPRPACKEMDRIKKHHSNIYRAAVGAMGY